MSETTRASYSISIEYNINIKGWEWELLGPGLLQQKTAGFSQFLSVAMKDIEETINHLLKIQFPD